jgi:signal transduction histidine kinase
MLDLVISLASTFIIAVLGLIILLRNIRNLTYQLYGLVSAVLILWFAAIYFSNHVHTYPLQLFTNKLSLFIGFLLIQVVWLLSIYFPRKLAPHKLQIKISFIVTPILLFLTLFTHYVVASITYIKSDQVSEINLGKAYDLYILTSLLFFVFLNYNFYKSYKYKGLSRLQRQQIIYASVGFVLSFIWSILTAAIIPSFTHSWYISKFAALGSLFLVFFLSYAIIRHKLFDIKLIVARSFAYFLTLATLALIFIVPTILITTNLLHTSLKTESITVLVAVTFIVAIIFQPIQAVFNRLTNKVFYRDFYEPQEVIDRLSNLLVGSVDVDHIIKGSRRILSGAVKPQTFSYILIADAKSVEENASLLKLLGGINTALILADEIDPTRNSVLYDMIREKGISAIMRLRTPSNDLGFMVLGHKQSGAIYSENDKRLISISADEIAISLQNALHFREIQNFNITLQEKIEVATKQLRDANEKLKILDANKDDFISMASHQLRTPLTSIKGYVSMVLEGDAGKINKTQDKFLMQAFTSSKRMANLVSDLLNVSRIESGKFFINAQPVNLADLTTEIVSELTEMAKVRQITLTYKKPENFPLLMLDEDKIAQVITNFVDNAIHYGKERGNISVELADEGENVSMRVKDDGIGVPAKVQKQLFTKFFRAENAKVARPDGTGIGLYLAAKVIDSQGGKIIFESREGKGSTFGFSFPKEKLAVSISNVSQQPST